jgi:GH24 family phage-related lysozyme (muramidase)
VTNTAPITLEQLFRYKKPWGQLPHQDAAIIEMEEDIEANGYAAAMRRDRPWFKAWSQAGKQPDPIYLEPALRIIQEFEGCHLVAYGCPAGVWTVGWGNTQLDGRPVKQGDKISQSKADTMLRDNVETLQPSSTSLIPAAANYGGNQQAALISWMYNVGAGAVQESTLRTPPERRRSWHDRHPPRTAQVGQSQRQAPTRPYPPQSRRSRSFHRHQTHYHPTPTSKTHSWCPLLFPRHPQHHLRRTHPR